MDKREQDILKKIEDRTSGIEVPESLKPSRLEKKLEEQEGKRQKKVKRSWRRGAYLAAACAALAVGIYLYQTRDLGETEEHDTQEILAEETEEADGRTSDSSSERVKDAGDDYSEIYAYIKKQQKENAYGEGEIVDTMELAKSSGSSSGTKTANQAETADAASAESDTGAPDYSGTNVREENVEEAGIVKTDGNYLYVLKDNSMEIAIVDAKEDLKKAGEITVSGDTHIKEFYILEEEKKLVAAAEKDGDSTLVLTYDISNPEKPKKLGKVSQSGSYSSSRIAGGYLYLFSNYWIDGGAEKEELETYIPMAGGSLIREKDILLPPFEQACMYEVVTAVSLEHPSEISDSRAIFTNGGELYVSDKNIYYYETDYSGKKEKTKIRKIGYQDGRFAKAVSGSIDGYINDTFSIDEYGGYLRIVSTSGDSNAVYVLDKHMDICGSIKNLAKDEQIYSARFLGDTGYFVTFRQVDPLFSVDLSEPDNPKITGRLKIPGFSEYLHFYGKNRLLGIGMNADEETGVTEGVKLSMFDISDKTDVKEAQKYTLKNVYGTDVSYDYKAALIDAKKNFIGFSAYAEGGNRYYVFSYDEEKGFQCRLAEEINGSPEHAARGVYIGDTLYVVQGNVIEAYSLKTYEKTGDIIL